ncbi:hypothetical protein ACFL1X_08245 [Candidatus Hydrogenedentota bacterium]
MMRRFSLATGALSSLAVILLITGCMVPLELIFGLSLGTSEIESADFSDTEEQEIIVETLISN